MVFMGTSATMWSTKETRAIAGISGAGGVRHEITEITREKSNCSCTKMVGELFLDLSGHDDFCALLLLRLADMSIINEEPRRPS